MEQIENKIYFLLCPSLRKFVNNTTQNPERSTSYDDNRTFYSRLEANNMYYRKLYYEDEYNIVRKDYVLVVADECLEERLKELVEKSLFKIMMFSNSRTNNLCRTPDKNQTKLDC